MPLIQVWLRKGTTQEHRKSIADGIHRAMVDVLAIPEDDYFQVTHELDAEDMLFDPNYFGLPRSERFIMVRLSFNARPAAMKASPQLSAVRKPVQAAWQSKAPARFAPRRSCSRQAVEGSG